jgi:hypothetical protein
MRAKLKDALVSVGAGAVAAAVVAVAGASTPAFAKSTSALSGPHVTSARHAFRLTVSVGDDGGARSASVRLQLRDAHRRYQWSGTWHQLHPTNHFDESYAFTLTESHSSSFTFRAVVSGGYAVTNPVTVVVR